MGQNPEWSIVTELKKQYDVSSVSPDAPIPSDIDVLLVAQPSSLTQKQIDNLTAYVRKGGPTLLFLDPLPFENLQISPEVPKMPPGGPFGGGPPPEPKGDLRPLLDLLGIEWPTTEIVWNAYNPHPQLADLPPEVVFVEPGSGAEDAFNPDQVATSGLQEVVMLFPGLLRPQGRARPRVHPAAADQPARRHGAPGARSPSRASWASSASIRNRRALPDRQGLHPGRPRPGPGPPPSAEPGQGSGEGEGRRRRRTPPSRPRST